MIRPILVLLVFLIAGFVEVVALQYYFEERAPRRIYEAAVLSGKCPDCSVDSRPESACTPEKAYQLYIDEKRCTFGFRLGRQLSIVFVAVKLFFIGFCLLLVPGFRRWMFRS